MKHFDTFYVINITMQAIFTMLFEAGLFALFAWLAVKFLSAPEWIYIPFILFGLLAGAVTMVRFILTAMNSLKRLEEQRQNTESEKNNG